MFKPTPRILDALQDLLTRLTPAGSHEIDAIRESLAAGLAQRRPDVTAPLLRAVHVAYSRGVDLGPVLTAAAVRAGCALLGDRHPGATIEVRVPPYAAVQIGFEAGSRHTRGTPPNVVEMSPTTFLALATGTTTWDDARAVVQASGAHAWDAQRAFPLPGMTGVRT